MISIVGFFRDNKHKGITLSVWFYAAVFRFAIWAVPMKFLRKHFGIQGEESAHEASAEDYKYAKLIGRYVGRSADNTPWESKCLVRALTAQRLLKKKDIASTLYLGVGMQEGKMVAHAWLRVGQLYVTGGNGEGYAEVDRYRA